MTTAMKLSLCLLHLQFRVSIGVDVAHQNQRFINATSTSEPPLLDGSLYHELAFDAIVSATEVPSDVAGARVIIVYCMLLLGISTPPQ